MVLPTKDDRAFRGLIAAPFTALHPDGSLHLGAIEAQAQLLVRDNVRGAFVCGTTGEGASLSSDERRQVAERWRSVAGNRLEIIVHVGHASVVEACALATHAQQIGADAVATVAPYFFKPRGPAELVEFCAQVAAAAPALRFYYYHVPLFTNVFVPVADFLALAEARIPTLAGAKFTNEDLLDYGRCLDWAGDRFEIFFGRDEMLLAALGIGARSAVGTTYNFAAPLYHRVVDAWERGDHAAAQGAQRQARAMMTVFLRHGGLPAMKAVMQWFGVECGPYRSPVTNLTPAQQTALRVDLEGVGFFDSLRS